MDATGAPSPFTGPDTGWQLPWADRSFDLVCAYGVLDDLADPVLARAFDELVRVSRRNILLYGGGGRARDGWETVCLRHDVRKHPLHQLIVPYDGLDWLTEPAALLFERLPDRLSIAPSVADLAATRDLHMDMLREGGRRADAHVARYMLARQFVRPGDRVLDAACGMGYGSAILAEGTLADRITGLDVDPFAISYAADHYARRGSRLSFEARDLATLADMPASSFDIVVSFETLEHIADPDAFLAACRRILTPGGRLICSVPNEWVDDTGHDPNPYHLHVFNRRSLEATCARHFLIERVYGQTAGGGMKLPAAGRALWPAETTSDRAATRDAEWWLLAGMKSPAETADAPFRHGLLDRAVDDRTNVLAFDRDYDNPWLARALVTIGLRATSPELLDRLADETLSATDADTADAGAALCVKMYAAIDRGEAPDDDLLSRVRRYVGRPTSVPHVRRWQISLSYADAIAAIRTGDAGQAAAALELCATADALAFSALLATKTVGAALLRGWMAAQAHDTDDARRWWTLGIDHAERALQRPWEELLLHREAPAIFGLREAALVVDLASRCATGLHLLPHLADRPGVMASQIFESLTDRAIRAEETQRAVERDRDDALAIAASASAAREAAERRAAAAEQEVARLRAHSPAAALLNAEGPIPGGVTVAIFGAGSGGRQALAALRSRGAVIDCIADNDAARHGLTIDGVPVVDPALLPGRHVDIIAVASLPGRRAIFAQLAGMGFEIGRDVAAIGPNGWHAQP